MATAAIPLPLILISLLLPFMHDALCRWMLKPMPFVVHDKFSRAETCKLHQLSEASLSDVPRLAVLTFVSRDATELCHAFMRYYTSQGIRAEHIFVIEADAAPDPSPCYARASLPPENIYKKPFPRTASQPSSFNSDHRILTLMEMQRWLLSSGFTHTIVVDLDEILIADSRLYANLHNYVVRNMGREVVAPVGYEVQYAPSLGDRELDWGRSPLLVQRRAMVSACGMSKPILSRVPSTFTLSTHNLLAPPYKACGDHLDCTDASLSLVHVKCIDERIWLDPKLADRDRTGLNSSVTSMRGYFRGRCGEVERWARTPCALTKEGESAPGAGAACGRLKLRFGMRQPAVPVEPIPAWAAGLY